MGKISQNGHGKIQKIFSNYRKQKADDKQLKNVKKKNILLIYWASLVFKLFFMRFNICLISQDLKNLCKAVLCIATHIIYTHTLINHSTISN